jgi:AraC-like DNA-binding protein
MDIRAFFLYSGIIMDNRDLAGRQIIPGSWPAIRLGPKVEYRLDPIHASWRFPALRESYRTEHSHCVFHFLMASEGTGSFLVAGEALPVVAPAVFLVSPEVPHVFSTTMAEALVYHEFTFALRGQGAPQTWEELLNLCFPDLGICWKASIKEPVGKAIQPGKASHPVMAHQPCRVLYPGRELAGRIETIVLGLTAVLSGRKNNAFLDTYIRMLLTLAAEAISENTDSGSGKGRRGNDLGADPLAAVMAYLEEHAIEHFPLTLLAGLAGLSEKHVCRAFKKRYGKTIFQVKRDKVLQRAERLLVSTRYPLKQIAQMTGFLDEYHFSKAFRNHFGKPPGAWRKSASTGNTQ